MGLGVLLALAGLGHGLPSPLDRPISGLLNGLLGREPGPAVWWVADRAGARVWGLDQDLFFRHEIPVACPVGISSAGSSLWIVSVPEGGQRGASHWRRLDERGIVRADYWGAAFCALAGQADGGVVGLVGTTGQRECVGWDLHGVELWRRPFPGATCMASQGPHVLVAGGTNLFVLNRGTGVTELYETLSGTGGEEPAPQVIGLAPGPRDGWWCLDRAGDLRLLNARLVPEWKRRTSTLDGLLAGDLERAWVIPRGREWATAWDDQGRRKVNRPWPFMGVGVLAMDEGGQLLAAEPGVLVRITADGLISCSQAGLSFAVGIAAHRFLGGALGADQPTAPATLSRR